MELPYPVGQLNGDLMGSLEGWLPNGQHEPARWNWGAPPPPPTKPGCLGGEVKID